MEARFEVRTNRIESKLDTIIAGSSELKSEFRGAKWWAIGTALTVLAIFITALLVFSQQEQSWTQTFLASLASVHH